LIELIHGLWAERISNLWAVEGNPHDTQVLVTVISNVLELLKTLNQAPLGAVEGL
jgi:hypothetical protein